MEILCKRTILQLLLLVVSVIAVQDTTNCFRILENSAANQEVGIVDTGRDTSNNYRFANQQATTKPSLRK